MIHFYFIFFFTIGRQIGFYSVMNLILRSVANGVIGFQYPVTLKEKYSRGPYLIPVLVTHIKADPPSWIRLMVLGNISDDLPSMITLTLTCNILLLLFKLSILFSFSGTKMWIVSVNISLVSDRFVKVVSHFPWVVFCQFCQLFLTDQSTPIISWRDPGRFNLSLPDTWMWIKAAFKMAEAHYKPPGLEAWDIVIVVLYFIVVLGVGLYVSIYSKFF